MEMTDNIFYRPALPTAIALGTFDGVHLGHRAVISAAVELARADKLMPAVFTFADLPRNSFLPEGERIPALCSAEEKAGLIGKLGVELLICPRFEHLRYMPAEEFIEDVLIGALKAKHIVCGYDHRFGAGGKGDAELLMRICRGYGAGVTVVPPVLYSGRRISSTDVRAALAAGEVEKAEAMLGRSLSAKPRFDR